MHRWVLHTDGVYGVETGGASINHFLGIDRVEILKGPQGTLYGRNTTGGAVNIYARQPELGRLVGEINGGYGSYARQEASGVVNIPLVEGLAALRVAIGAYERSGYGRDVLQ